MFREIKADISIVGNEHFNFDVKFFALQKKCAPWGSKNMQMTSIESSSVYSHWGIGSAKTIVVVR